MGDFLQGEFNFDAEGDEQGYQSWIEDLERQQQEFARRYNVVLGCRVRVTIRGFDDPVEGLLHPDTPKTKPPRGKKRAAVRFRIGGIAVDRRDILGIVRLD